MPVVVDYWAKHNVIVASRRFCHALGIAVVAIVPLVMFFASVVTFHKPQVVALLLLRTVEGYFHLLVLLTTSMLPLVCIVLISTTKDGRRKQFLNVILAGMATAFYTISITLLYYRISTGSAFDLSIVWYHFDDAVRTLLVLSSQHTSGLIVCAGLAVCHFFGLLRILSMQWDHRRYGFSTRRTRQTCLNNIAVGIFVVFLASQWLSTNGLRNLILESSGRASQARSLYAQYFDESIRRNQRGLASSQSDLSQPNLFIVQLESINAGLVTPVITPNLLEVARKNGVLFPRAQAASVFTILSMETILCATLPTIEKNLAAMDSVHDQLRCLPRILKEKGFKTLYFQAYPNLKFNNMDQFLRSIGFDETHAEDIMKPGDATLKWGFVEDVFYRRVFEYLEKFRNEKMFVYIVPGSANHYPFFDAEIEGMFTSLRTLFPYQAPRNIRERLANTMFIQDHFFGMMYRELYRVPFGDTSQMFVLGDHSWPTELHTGNNHNLKGAFQENFETTMVFLPPNRSQGANSDGDRRIVSRLHSYLDLSATVLEMYGIKQHLSYGESFLGDLDGDSSSHLKPNRCILSVQPFSGGQIVVINYPAKYIFDLKNDSVIVYNLETDPNELNAAETVKIDADRLAYLESCLQDLTGEPGRVRKQLRSRRRITP